MWQSASTPPQWHELTVVDISAKASPLPRSRDLMIWPLSTLICGALSKKWLRFLQCLQLWETWGNESEYRLQKLNNHYCRVSGMILSICSLRTGKQRQQIFNSLEYYKNWVTLQNGVLLSFVLFLTVSNINLCRNFHPLQSPCLLNYFTS